MLKNIFIAVTLALASFHSHCAFIIASADSNIAGNDIFISNVFGGQNAYIRHGVSNLFASANWASGPSFTPYLNSVSSGATLTASNLIGADWVIAGSGSLWSEQELILLENFHLNGGNVFVVGEYGTYDNINISGNQALAAIGSSMQFLLETTSVGASGTSFNTVYPDPLTVGMTYWNGSAPGDIVGGTLLVSHISERRVLAYENSTVVPVPAAMYFFLLAITGLLGTKWRLS